jgi:hypothetical protein
MRALMKLVTVALAAAAMLPGTALASKATKTAYRAGLTAFQHGYPPLLSLESQSTFPLNTLVSIAGPSDPSNNLVVMPNVDTAYAVAKLDLSAGPRTVHMPAEPGRYHMMQLMDAYTNVFGYIGTRTTGDGAVDAMIVGPGFKGTVPAGVKLLRSPTNQALLLGRTLIEPADTLASLRALVGQYTLDGAAPIVLDKPPGRKPGVAPKGAAFVQAFNAFLAVNPPAAAEQKVLKPLAKYGLGAGQGTKVYDLPNPTRKAFLAGIHDGPIALRKAVRKLRVRDSHQHHGWVVLAPQTGNYGTNYLLREIVAKVGLWANTPAEATYPNADADSEGRRLSGQHRYQVTFKTPLPAKAFWSLTVYDGALHLFENPLKRYALGDRSGLVEHGGKVTLTLSRKAPKQDKQNWLPTPNGHFVVTLRLYIPTKTALKAGWEPPGIRCLDC